MRVGWVNIAQLWVESVRCTYLWAQLQVATFEVSAVELSLPLTVSINDALNTLQWGVNG